MINKNVYFRFEENLNNGTLLIFDLKNKKIYKGTKKEYQILLLLEKGIKSDDLLNYALKNSSNGAYIHIKSFIDNLKCNNIIVEE